MIVVDSILIVFVVVEVVLVTEVLVVHCSSYSDSGISLKGLSWRCGRVGKTV